MDSNLQAIFAAHAGEIKQLTEKAEQNDALAQYELGYCYCFGEDVEPSYEEAVKWFRRAAEADVPQAMYHLGECYFYGHGVEKDVDEARHWYKLASVYDCMEAVDAIRFDLHYEYVGDGISCDLIAIFKKAEEGDAEAQWNVAWWYDNHPDVLNAESEAERWYRISAENGYTPSHGEDLTEAKGCL